MKTPAVPLCLALVAGMFLPQPESPAYAFTTALVALVLALACAARRRAVSGSVGVVIAFASIGNVASTLHAHAVERAKLGRIYDELGERTFSSPRRVSGRLRREPEGRFDVTVLIVDVEVVEVGRRAIAASGGLRVGVRGERRAHLASLSAGDRVRLWAVVREPAFFANPGSFDGRRNLERQHIDLVGSIKSGLLVSRLERSSSPAAWISRFRSVVIERIESELPAPDTAAVVVALVTGVRAELSPELSRVYQRAGVFHVMAISGAHVAIWIAFLYRLMRWMGLSTRSTLAVLLLLLPLYAVFCGSRPPVVRAVLMAVLLIGARLQSLRAPVANALALAALCLLAWEPASLVDAGFQLTMAAMTSIVVLYERFAERLVPLGFLAKPLAISLAAQLGVMPVAAWHFHRLSLGAPVASLVAMPLAAVICILGVVLAFVAGTPIVASVVSVVTHYAVTALTTFAELFAELPAVSLRVGAPSIGFIVVYSGALLLLLSRVKRVQLAGCALLAAALLVAIHPLRLPSGALELNALDVGHGDAILLTLPNGANVLVDGGGLPFASLDIGESVVLPFLLDRGVRRLDAVVLTHADFDHIGGLATVVSELRVDSIWQGSPDTERAAYRELRARAHRRGVPVRTLRRGERFGLGGASFEVLAAGENAGQASNDRSVVLKVGFGGRHVLLTGDAEADLERRLVRSGSDLRADVLKLAHHGSRSSTSSAFLDAVQPSFAVVSARRNRARPIPSSVVLHRLRARGIEYARTDRNGTITVRIHADGEMEISTFRQER